MSWARVEITTAHNGWQLVGAFLAAGDEPQDLAADERTYNAVKAAIAAAASGDGKIVLEEIPYGANGAHYFLEGATEDQQIVLVAWRGAKKTSNCILIPRGTLTWTVGAQASVTNGYKVADTLAVTEPAASSAPWKVYSPADDTVAECTGDLKGDDVQIWVPTTIGCDAKLWAKYY